MLVLPRDEFVNFLPLDLPPKHDFGQCGVDMPALEIIRNQAGIVLCAAHQSPHGLVWEIDAIDFDPPTAEDQLTTIMRVEAVPHRGDLKITALLTGPGALPCTLDNLEFFSDHYHLLVAMGMGMYPPPPHILFEHFVEFEAECQKRLGQPKRPTAALPAIDAGTNVILFRRPQNGSGA